MALFLFYFFFFFVRLLCFVFFAGVNEIDHQFCVRFGNLIKLLILNSLSLTEKKKNWRLVQMWVHANHNYVRVLCSWKSRATTERNASYLRYLEITGKNFPYLRLLATKAHLSNVFAVRAAIISVSSISLPHNINICRIFAER